MKEIDSHTQKIEKLCSWTYLLEKKSSTKICKICNFQYLTDVRTRFVKAWMSNDSLV